MRRGLTQDGEPMIGDMRSAQCCRSKKSDVELIWSLLLVDTVYFSHVPVATSKLTSMLPTNVIAADQVSS
jgi:hypothetical protein